MLPRHLSWPGMRECDVTDDVTRRNMYGIVLTQGQRNDVARFLNPELLRADWPQLRDALDPRLRDYCERRFALPAVSGAPAEAYGAERRRRRKGRGRMPESDRRQAARPTAVEGL